MASRSEFDRARLFSTKVSLFWILLEQQWVDSTKNSWVERRVWMWKVPVGRHCLGRAIELMVRVTEALTSEEVKGEKEILLVLVSIVMAGDTATFLT